MMWGISKKNQQPWLENQSGHLLYRARLWKVLLPMVMLVTVGYVECVSLPPHQLDICYFALSQESIQHKKDRLIILADMGHDPDEEQQITHLLMTSNMFDLEGLIAVTGRFFRKNPPATVKELNPHLFHRLIDGYAAIYPNLQMHATGWQSPEYLHSIVANGQRGNGVSDIGPGKSTEGSRLIVEAVTKKDPRPLYIIVNSGSNTLAQALWDYRQSHSEEALEAFVAKLRVFDNGGQDEAGAWICHEFPSIHWIRSHHQTRSYGGPSNQEVGPHTWHPYSYDPLGQHAWAREHIQSNHGALGALCPDRTVGSITHYIEGGGTIPWMSFVVPGLSDHSEPSWGGWSGRYSHKKVDNAPSAYAIVRVDEEPFYPLAAYVDHDEIIDRWFNPEDGKWYEDKYTPVWRWRQAMWNDYAARMDWCIQEFSQANHHPHAVLNGSDGDEILKVTALPGEIIKLDATGSIDPDHDALRFSWWIYSEAGRSPYEKALKIEKSTSEVTALSIPEDAAEKELHIILEVWDDNGIIPLVDYRRLVVYVE